MNKNAPKIILAAVILAVAAALIFYRMSSGGAASEVGDDGLVGQTFEETDAANEQLADDEAPSLQGLVKDDF